MTGNALRRSIRVTGDSATAVGYQEFTGLKDGTVSLNRAAYRLVTFRCVDGTWCIHGVYTIGLDNEEGVRFCRRGFCD